MTIMLSFMQALLKMPRHWVVWVGLLMVLNMLFPLFFLTTLEGKVVLATLIANAGLMLFIFAKKGFVRLLGLGHILWVPLIVWLLERVDFTISDTGLEQWILAVIVLNGLSLVIDLLDVVRYFEGERQPTVTLST
ncbi:hypothetical protein MNBD_NITROSPINAE05-202 [hydrothermal vent metagenome]|uniref:Uncharacterized protein n=1 Tax=hydrothermal vent metagenome TaxID=652676 RepID=A0A3B1CIR5_9ZZZZ